MGGSPVFARDVIPKYLQSTKGVKQKDAQPQVRVGRRCIFYCFKTRCSNKCTWEWNIFSSAWLVCEKSVERSKSSRAGCSVWPVSDARHLWSLTPARNQKYPLALSRRIYRDSTGSESLWYANFFFQTPVCMLWEVTELLILLSLLDSVSETKRQYR